jgi:hypothetical protein
MPAEEVLVVETQAAERVAAGWEVAASEVAERAAEGLEVAK